MDNTQQNIVIYNTADGKTSVKLYARDGVVRMRQNEPSSFPRRSMGTRKQGKVSP